MFRVSHRIPVPSDRIPTRPCGIPTELATELNMSLRERKNGREESELEREGKNRGSERNDNFRRQRIGRHKDREGEIISNHPFVYSPLLVLFCVVRRSSWKEGGRERESVMPSLSVLLLHPSWFIRSHALPHTHPRTHAHTHSFSFATEATEKM